ncbi:MAG: hypothetical protein KDA88_10980 [Planctomycetaceae bacterium]|nr:hypothetical protein [Planctomycetaceae bacterium]MCB9951124.1 hypothetical protein [Planctomycetaceae bacterium]
MIALGSVYRGPELPGTRIDLAITKAMNAAAELRGSFEFGSGPAINVVFHVPGSLGKPDWDGLRDATYSRKLQLLMVQVAVPDDVVESPGLETFIIEGLYGANAIAFEFFRQKKLTFPLADAERMVVSIAAIMHDS